MNRAIQMIKQSEPVYEAELFEDLCFYYHPGAVGVAIEKMIEAGEIRRDHSDRNGPTIYIRRRPI